MTTDDLRRSYPEILAWADRTGREEEIRDLIERLQGELSADPTALTQLRSLLQRLETVATIQVPSAWVATANARLAELEAAAQARPGVLDRARGLLAEAVRIVEATLVGDTLSGQALQGIRGAAIHRPRHLHFVSELGDVHLQVNTAPKNSAVMGQFVPARPDLVGASIQARAIVSDDVQVVDLDPGAQFHFTDVHDGEVRIELSMGTESLQLAPFWIRPRHEE